jgi:RecB family exonuclease
LELLRNFLAFTTDRQIVLNWATRVEEKFSFALNPVLTITGRIDRLDVGPRDEALVIDYKYSAAGKIRERVEDNDGGSLVQGGLYLAAAQRALGLQPAGMLYCGLRKEIAWGGRHIAIAGLERIGESRTREALQDLIDTASGTAARVFESITSGEIAARPADEKKCVWCDFRDACRVESIAIARIAGAQ